MCLEVLKRFQKNVITLHVHFRTMNLRENELDEMNISDYTASFPQYSKKT